MKIKIELKPDDGIDPYVKMHDEGKPIEIVKKGLPKLIENIGRE